MYVYTVDSQYFGSLNHLQYTGHLVKMLLHKTRPEMRPLTIPLHWPVLAAPNYVFNVFYTFITAGYDILGVVWQITHK